MGTAEPANTRAQAALLSLCSLITPTRAGMTTMPCICCRTQLSARLASTSIRLRPMSPAHTGRTVVMRRTDAHALLAVMMMMVMMVMIAATMVVIMSRQVWTAVMHSDSTLRPLLERQLALACFLGFRVEISWGSPMNGLVF